MMRMRTMTTAETHVRPGQPAGQRCGSGARWSCWRRPACTRRGVESGREGLAGRRQRHSTQALQTSRATLMLRCAPAAL